MDGGAQATAGEETAAPARPGGPPAPPAAPAREAGADAVSVTYVMTTADLRAAGFRTAWYSTASMAMGSFALVTGVITFVLLRDGIGLVVAGVGLLWATGLLPGMLTAFMAGRRPDLMLQPTELMVTQAGIRSASTLSASETRWPAYKRLRVAGPTLLFELGTGAVMIVPTRAFSADQVERVAGWAAAAEILDRSSPRAPILKGVAIGVAFAAGIPGLMALAFAAGILA